jgi:23S rRNA pseudouridine2457 synthase
VQLVEQPEILYVGATASNNYGPHTWLLITLTEGKCNQVSHIVGAIHHRCKRLIRLSIEDLHLGELEPGMVRELEERDFFSQLNIET